MEELEQRPMTDFGRVVLLDMWHPLITHAHPQPHIIVKIGGADGAMEVYGRNLPLTSETVVLINAWEPHSYVGSRGGPAFLLAFFSLAQDVRVSATTYDIDRLQLERDRLLAQQQEVHSDLERLGQEPAIRKLSIDAGLTQLGEPIVLTGR